MGFLLEPSAVPELQLLEMGQIELGMVSTIAEQSIAQALNGRYVMVDWNTSFHAQHAHAFPDAPPPKVWVSTGRLAFDLLRNTEGAAYLPQQLIQGDVDSRRLHPVEAAPAISLRIYAAYPVWSERQDLIKQVLEIARRHL